MQCELLYRELNNGSVTAEVNHIKGMQGGGSPHRAGALKLTLTEGLLGGTYLCCSREGCDFYNHQAFTRRSLGVVSGRSRVICSCCYPMCAHCRTKRIDAGDTWCRKCGKWFR